MNNKLLKRGTNVNRQIRVSSEDKALEPFDSTHLISCSKADATFIAKTAVLNLMYDLNRLRDSNFSNFFNKLGGTPQLDLLKTYLKEKKEPKDIMKYTNNSTSVNIIKKLVETIKEKLVNEKLIETKEGQLKDVPFLIAQSVISPKIHITFIESEKINLEFADNLSKVHIKINQLGLRGMILKKNAQTAALVYCSNKTWLLWKFFNEMKYINYSNAILEIVDSGFYPEVIMYSNTSNPEDTKLDLEIYRNIIFAEGPPIEEHKSQLNSLPDLKKFTNFVAGKELAIKEDPNKNAQKINVPIKTNFEVVQIENPIRDNKKTQENDLYCSSFGQENNFLTEKNAEKMKVEIGKDKVGVNENSNMWKCKVCKLKVRLDKVNCDCGYKNAILAKAHVIGFKAGVPCANCGEYSKDFLCLKCVRENYWSCTYCTFINNGNGPCCGCYKSKLNR
ncbi:hypothetical protein SteCoe_35268 [Stentor coeruleus]|uniref:RanBP2-type domain-containing protein n=1 Tax=Stentor coeruleus TaxID=5963 RepID=A0A1R2ASP8_9CILI|nr:hypothetical protein SteCoe_35268 [Stentor coeruleus]